MNVDSVIEMAWCDKTSYDSIKFQTGLVEKDVIKIIKSNLKKTSLKLGAKGSVLEKLRITKSETQIILFKRDLRITNYDRN